MWLPLAARTRTPHRGVGGLATGTASGVPGLHVPLDLGAPTCPPGRPNNRRLHSAASEATSEAVPLGGTREAVPRSASWLGQYAATEAASVAGESLGEGERTDAGEAAATPGRDGIGPVPATPSTASGGRQHVTWGFGQAHSPTGTAAGGCGGPGGGAGALPLPRCGAGELSLNVAQWLTPSHGPSADVCGLFAGEDGSESIALTSRVVKGTVHVSVRGGDLAGIASVWEHRHVFRAVAAQQSGLA